MSEKQMCATILFTNFAGQVLLFLRDDIPQIKCPGMWDCLGGHAEEGESPEDCIRREMEEELGLNLTEPEPYKVVEYPDRIDHIFTQTLRMTEDELNKQLNEGQRVRWFSEEDVKSTELAFGFNEMVEQFFNDRFRAT